MAALAVKTAIDRIVGEGPRQRVALRRSGSKRNSSAPMTIRVLLVDDHAIVLEGLRALIDSQPDIAVVALTQDGAEVVPLAREVEPDVVLLDLELGSVGGIQVLAQIQGLPKPPKVLVLTAYKDGETLRSVLDAGADGLSFKTEPPDRTIAAIREVHAGRLVFPQAARRWLLKPRDRVKRPGELTAREREVWALVAQGLTNRQIAERLEVGENTVKFHMQNLFLKLDVSNRTEAAMKFVEAERAGGA